jgi:very-short-patch-repair endonuclease
MVAERASKQWGVVSRAELRALGVAGATVDVWVRRGRLHVVHRGVYAVGHTVLRREGRWMAAVLAGGPGAVLSHLSAAACWELLQETSARVEITGPASRRGVPGIRLHRCRSLDARDSTDHEGIPITTIPRTLLDLASTVKPHRLERALAQAERLRLYDHRAIGELLARANGRRGIRVLAQATAQEPAFTRSELEAWFLNLVRDDDLPEPLVNFSLTAPDHPRIEVDFYGPSHRLIVELDGWETHRTRAAFEQDRRRDAALQAAGCSVLRFTRREPPATIKRRLRAMLTGTAGGGRSTAAGHARMMSDAL